jgi:PAS domain S-box-containing protein
MMENIGLNSQHYRHLFETMGYGCIITDRAGLIQEVNGSARRILGSSPLIGKMISDFFTDRDRAAVRAWLTTLQHSFTPQEWNLPLVLDDSPLIYVTLSVSVAWEDNTPAALYWILLDTTSRKQIEDQLYILNTQLEKRVWERTAELEVEKRLKDEALRREHAARVEAEALRDLAMVLNSTLDLSEVLDSILANLGRVVLYDAALIMLIEGDSARVVRSQGFEELSGVEEALQGLTLSVESYPLSYMVETQKPFILSDWMAGRQWLQIPNLHLVQSVVGVQITTRGDLLGFVTLFSFTPGFFTYRHGSQLQAFAAQAAIAIRNAKAHQQGRQLAMLEERQRIARDLHDAVSQTLFSASMLAEALPRLWKRHPDRVIENLHQLHTLVRGAFAELRTLLVELRPMTIFKVDLGTLLSQLAEAAKTRHRMNIVVAVPKERIEIPGEIKMVFYRVAQEAINNIIKHSRASEVYIRLDTTTDSFDLSIQDNGVGMDTEKTTGGIGLEMMHERTESIGAMLEIISSPGAGTQIKMNWRT